MAQAQAFFDEGKYYPAAQRYAQSSANFEEVALKFNDAGERDALRSYLVSRLERTRKSVSWKTYCSYLIEIPRTKTRYLSQDITQRMMLATWLIEFYLSK